MGESVIVITYNVCIIPEINKTIVLVLHITYTCRDETKIRSTCLFIANRTYKNVGSCVFKVSVTVMSHEMSLCFCEQKVDSKINFH